MAKEYQNDKLYTSEEIDKILDEIINGNNYEVYMDEETKKARKAKKQINEAEIEAKRKKYAEEFVEKKEKEAQKEEDVEEVELEFVGVYPEACVDNDETSTFNNKKSEPVKEPETKEEKEIIESAEIEQKTKLSTRAKRVLAGALVVGTMAGIIVGFNKLGKLAAKNAAENNKPQTNKPQIKDKKDKEDSNIITINDVNYVLDDTDSNSNTNKMGKKIVKSGNIDASKIVTDNNGTQWVSKEAQENYNNKKSTPSVSTKEVDGGYVVKDTKGNVIATGDSNSSIPAGWYKDPVSGKILKEGTSFTVDENGDLIDNSKNIDESNKIGTVVKETFEEVKEDVKEDYEWAAGEYEKYINSKDFNCYVLDGKLYYGTFNLEEFNAKAKSTIKSIKPVVEETYEEVKEEGKEIFEQLEEKVIEKKEEIKEQKEVKEEAKEEKVVEEEIIEEETEAVWAEGEFEKFINSTDFNCYELDGKLYYGTMPEVSKTLVLK